MDWIIYNWFKWNVTFYKITKNLFGNISSFGKIYKFSKYNMYNMVEENEEKKLKEDTKK